MRPATTFARLLLTIALITVGPLWLVPEADARITRVQVTTHETPTFGGYSWPGRARQRVPPARGTHGGVERLGCRGGDQRGGLQHAHRRPGRSEHAAADRQES